MKPAPKKKINPFMTFDDLQKKVKGELAPNPKTTKIDDESPKQVQKIVNKEIIVEQPILESIIEKSNAHEELVNAHVTTLNEHEESINTHANYTSNELNAHVNITLNESNSIFNSTLNSLNEHVNAHVKPLNEHVNVTSQCNIINAHDKSTSINIKDRLMKLGVVKKKVEIKKAQLRKETKLFSVLRYIVGNILEANLTLEMDDIKTLYRITDSIDISDLGKKIKSSPQSVRNTADVLIERFNMRHIYAEKGRNGFTVYGFRDDEFGSIIKLINSMEENAHDKSTREMESNITSSPPSSKLVVNYTTKLTREEEGLPKFDVDSISISPVSSLGITRKQIQDIYNQKLQFTNLELQEFVDRFAKYASDSRNIKNVHSIPAIFVKMAQHASRGQDPLAGVETDADILIRNQIEMLKKKNAEREKQQNELLDLSFENWRLTLNKEQSLSMVPETPLYKSGTKAYESALKNYFMQNIWSKGSIDLNL